MNEGAKMDEDEVKMATLIRASVRNEILELVRGLMRELVLSVVAMTVGMAIVNGWKFTRTAFPWIIGVAIAWQVIASATGAKDWTITLWIIGASILQEFSVRVPALMQVAAA
jgi:hypothetical protein